MAAVTLCSDFKAQENKIRHAPQPRSSICREMMGANSIILVFSNVKF